MTEQVQLLARDLDGTGSLHACAKGDPGAVKFIRADLVEPLVEALRELLRFCDDATDYELTHASSYQPYIDGRAALSSWEAGQ